MVRDIPSQTAQPPYFNIDPDTALADLDAPTDTAGFARIATACARGRADLAGGVEAFTDAVCHMHLDAMADKARGMADILIPYVGREMGLAVPGGSG